MSNFEPENQETPEETLRRLQGQADTPRPPLQDPYGPPPPIGYNPYLQPPANSEEASPTEQPYGSVRPGDEGDPYGGYQPPGYPVGQDGPPYGYGGYNQGQQEHPSAQTLMIMGIVGLLCCSIISPFVFFYAHRYRKDAELTGNYSTGGSLQAAWIISLVGTVLFGLGVLYFSLTATVAVFGGL